MTDGSGELVPVSVTSHSSIADVAMASLSHPDTAGLMGATLRAPIASSPEMLGSIGAAFNPDVLADAEIEHDLMLEAGSEVQRTQPPYPPVVDPFGYLGDSSTIGTPDTADIVDIFGVDVTPLVSTSVSGVDITSGPDLSMVASISADTDAYLEIRNPSLVPNVGRASLGDQASGTHPPTAPGHASLGDAASGMFPLTALGLYI